MGFNSAFKGLKRMRQLFCRCFETVRRLTRESGRPITNLLTEKLLINHDAVYIHTCVQGAMASCILYVGIGCQSFVTGFGTFLSGKRTPIPTE